MSRNPVEQPESREDKDYMREHIENTTVAPQRLEREYISWIKGGMSDRESQELFGSQSQGEFPGIDRMIIVPVDLRETFYDDFLKQAFLGVYTSVSDEMSANQQEVFSDSIRQRLALSARNLIVMITSVAGSSARDQGQNAFETQTADRGRNVLSLADIVKLQIVFDQFGVLASNPEDPEDNEMISMAQEISRGDTLSPQTLDNFSNFRYESVRRVELYNASLGRAENETIGVPIDVATEARGYGTLLMLMNNAQLEQLVDHEISQLYSGASMDSVLSQIHFLALNTDIAPGVIYRKLTDLMQAHPQDAETIALTMQGIDTQRAQLAAEMSRLTNEFIASIEVGDVQTFGRNGTLGNLALILWGITTAAMSGVKMIFKPGSSIDHAVFLALGAGAANYGYNRMSGGRGTEGFEGLAQSFMVNADSRRDYGREVISSEAAKLTAQEVGFSITKDFYTNEEVINILRGLTSDGRDQFTIEQFETAFESNQNIPHETRDAYNLYRTSTNDEYLFIALNFTGHSFNMLDISNREEYIRYIGSRVGLLESDFEI
jgi:hypothetical protein